ncbi:MAG: hypothetical protein EB082_15275 [Verrucomicrobia bacterium]|nr:hypothetical protein [Verrucomicrobiota bacterium]
MISSPARSRRWTPRNPPTSLRTSRIRMVGGVTPRSARLSFAMTRLSCPRWKAWRARTPTPSPVCTRFGQSKASAHSTRHWPAGKEFSGADKNLLTKGEAVFKELCFACHGFDGRGMPVEGGKPGTTLAPPLAGSPRVVGQREAIIHILLKGLAGPINGKTYEALMVPMESNNDEWIASVASYVRNSFGNKAGMVSVKDVAALRAEAKIRTQPWTVEELAAALPNAPLANRAAWKLTASHNAAALTNAVDGKADTRYDTKKQQEPGMWVQIELPSETAITGVRLDAAGSGNDFPRGYKVELSADGQTWGKPVATGEGKAALTDIKFPTAKTKFIRITQTGSAPGKFWSIHELDVLSDSKGKIVEGKATAKLPTLE